MKLLLIKLGDLGDLVLASPVFRCLKQQLPQAELHLLTNDRYLPVMRANPHITGFHSENRFTYGLLDELKAESFDAVIDLQGGDLAVHVIHVLGLPHHSYRKRRLQEFLYTRLKWNLLPANEHQVDRYLHAVRKLGVKNDGRGLDFFIPKEAGTKLEDIPAAHHLGYIALAIGGSKWNKRMPVGKWRELVARIDHPMILIGDEADRIAGEEIAAVDPVKIYNACGKFSISESADLIAKSKFVVAHDTGMMHIAAALGKPIIAIWGSTRPTLGLSPYYPAPRPGDEPLSDNLEVRLWCRPCSTQGLDRCPQGHFKCMKQQSIVELEALVRKRLKAGK